MCKRKLSSLDSKVILSFLIIPFVLGQGKTGEFKHELPEGLELVDPKSLGLNDEIDLQKFLGNVKVLGGSQVGDTKTQILTVGFEGDENINFNDFHIPGLTDGNNTALPPKDKEIADMAFKKFKEFFQDPKTANQFEEHHKDKPFEMKHEHQKQFHRPVPMIHKPYTTPPSNPARNPPELSRWVTPPPPPHQFQQNRPPPSHIPPIQQQQQRPNNPPHRFNAQIKSHPPPLEFGARIPTSPNQQRPQLHQPHPPQNNPQHVPRPLHLPPQQQQQNFHRPPAHPNNNLPQLHLFERPPPPPLITRQPPPPQRQQPHQVSIAHHPPPNHHPQQIQTPVNPNPNHPQTTPPPSPKVPRVAPLLTTPKPIATPPPTTPQAFPIKQINPQEQNRGKIVRNQLLHLDNNIENHAFSSNNSPYYTIAQPTLKPFANTQTSNVVNNLYRNPFNFNPSDSSSAATSHVYIHQGATKTMNIIKHTPFHSTFQPPIRMAKNFAPIPITSTTPRPGFEVKPSIKLIPLSTNENAITDPVRMAQLRLFQKQKREQAEASNNLKVVLPQQNATSRPNPITTTPISITTSFPNEIGQPFQSPAYYQNNQPGHQQVLNIKQNDIEVINKGSFWLQPYKNEDKSRHRPQFFQIHQQQQPKPLPETLYAQQGRKRRPRHQRPKKGRRRPLTKAEFEYFFVQDDPEKVPVQKFRGPGPGRRKRGHKMRTLFNRMF